MAARWRAALACLACALLAHAAAGSDPGEVAPLVAGEFLLHDSESPPDAGLAWQPVRLPDVWAERRPGIGGSGWYRFEIPRPVQTEQRFGVLLGEVDMNAAVFVNGSWVGQGGSMTPPRVSENWSRPLYFVFPGELLARPRNVIHVRLLAEAWAWSRLDGLSIGPDRLLAPRYSRGLLLRQRAAEFGTMLGVVLILVIGMLWLGRRGDSIHGYFVLAAAAWTISNLNFHVVDLPLPYWRWQHLTQAALDWFAIVGVLVIHRLVGVRRPGIEGVLLGYGVFVSVAPLLVPRPWFAPLVTLQHLFALALTGYATLRIWRELLALPRLELVVNGVAIALCLAFGAFDFAAHVRLPEGREVRLLPYAGLLILLAAGSTLVLRFVRAYNRAERANLELEESVAASRLELEASYEHTRLLERERVLAGERERLMREVHDGIGGRLVSTLAMVESGRGAAHEVSLALRDALAEMRLVIDSLDPSIGDLPSLLGILRSRVEPSLRRQGLRFDWNVGDLPATPELGHEGFLHVLRILQEAITNVLKHAEARVVRISTGTRDGGLFIEVSDDGVGFTPDRTSTGRGLANMRARAERLGGSLEVTERRPGTRVELWLPIPATRRT